MAKTPAVGKKAAKTPKKASTGRKTKKVESYASYIYKVLKEVHPNTGISKRGMSIMNSFINDIFERLAQQSSHLTKYNKKTTLSAREVEGATKLIVPGELSKHARLDAIRAMATFTSSTTVLKYGDFSQN